MRPWSWRITCRWTATSCWTWSRNGSTTSSASQARRKMIKAFDNFMNTDPPIIEINNLTRRYGKLEAVNGLSLTGAARPLLRLFRPQRRGQNHDHQMPAEPAPPGFRHDAGVRPRPAQK